MIRPDLLITEHGFSVTELDSVPGGIGLTAWLNQTYSKVGQSSSPPTIEKDTTNSDGLEACPALLGGADGMLRGFAGIFGDASAVHIVVSEEAATYRPEMEWLARQLGPRFTLRASNFEDYAEGEAASELPARGLILSSLDPALLPIASQARFPIMVTDGFGPLPMNSAAYRLLSTNIQREVTLNAESFDRYSGARPEVFIPLPVSQEPPAPADSETFAPGQTVRMRRPPSMGGIGVIVSLPAGQTLMSSGLRTRAAEVQMETGETVLVPLVNLEVVG